MCWDWEWHARNWRPPDGGRNSRLFHCTSEPDLWIMIHSVDKHVRCHSFPVSQLATMTFAMSLIPPCVGLKQAGQRRRKERPSCRREWRLWSPVLANSWMHVVRQVSSILKFLMLVTSRQGPQQPRPSFLFWLQSPISGHIVLDEDPSAPLLIKGRSPPNFGPCLLWPNGIRWGPSSPRKGHSSPTPLFCCGHSRPFQLLLSSCYCILL